jgi:uncharacterized membrane protein (Fun14 family)
MRFRTSKNMVYHNWQGVQVSELPVDDLVFSAGGGFLFGAVAGYAIKKVMKIAAVVIGLFVAGLVYLSYKGWIDVKWMEMENATRTTLTNIVGQAVHVLNDTASQFATHSSAIQGHYIGTGSLLHCFLLFRVCRYSTSSRQFFST